MLLQLSTVVLMQNFNCMIQNNGQMFVAKERFGSLHEMVASASSDSDVDKILDKVKNVYMH